MAARTHNVTGAKGGVTTVNAGRVGSSARQASLIRKRMGRHSARRK